MACPPSDAAIALYPGGFTVPKPEAMLDLADGGPEVIADDHDEAIEPIRVEPQPGFILPVEVEAFPQPVPASEETPEPRFGPGEESEFPAQVAAPAHEDEQGTPPAMPYVEDDAPACKKCASCPQGCCTKSPCAKNAAKDCSAKTSCSKDCASATCAKGCTTPPCTACSSVKSTCGAKVCCVQCCCDWLMNAFGLASGGKCCDSKPLATQPVLPLSDSPTIEVPAPDKSKGDSGKNDDVPNCQEDPSYSHQYPSCPYTGAPCNTCPYYPSMHNPEKVAPEGSPLDELLPAKRKAKKSPASSLLRLMPQTYTGLFDPISLGVRHDGVASALRAVTVPAAEDWDIHPEVDTMEARPTDVDKVSSPNEPF